MERQLRQEPQAPTPQMPVQRTVQPYPELTVADIEEFRKTGRFSKPTGKYEEAIARSGILNKRTNQEILDAINF